MADLPSLERRAQRATIRTLPLTWVILSLTALNLIGTVVLIFR